MRFDLREASGALGDLGTFIPLVVSLIAVCGMDGGTVLVFAGLFNVLSGLLFDQPVPVQPMKAIAAVAIAEGLAPGAIAAAGFATGTVVLVLGLTGWVAVVERRIPRPVVRGIQLGVGLKLAAKGIAIPLGLGWWGVDGMVLALGAGALVLLTARWQRFPSALLLLIAGLLVLSFERPDALGGAPVGWAGPEWIWPEAEQWRTGLLRGALPQLPLTLLNSVIAVCALSGDLFPGRRLPTGKMAVSVGLMNVSACLFGAMPACHGSGGLAGQYRFGARTGGSVVMLGAAKIGLGVLFGSAVAPALAAFPASILGVLLFFAGLELSIPARQARGREEFFAMAATTAGILAANTAVGFALGLVASFFLLRPASPK